jgi:effector-binding domain-containing protein
MRSRCAGASFDGMHESSETVFLENRERLPVLSIRGTVPVAELVEAQGERLLELWHSLQAQNLSPAGPPFVRYHTFGEIETDLEVGVPVSREATGAGRVEARNLPGGAAITTRHFGAHDRLAEAYFRLTTWLRNHEREPAGPPWEVYSWIDLSNEPDPAAWPPPTEWRTELVQPIASDD